MTPPLILLSNDDGIDAPAIHLLADAIEAAGIAEALVLAPERERSAASHAITLHKPLRLRPRGERRFALSGTPVDCVYLGVIQLAPRRPSLIVSGINRGYNLGTDVFYSGTVAAAVEGGLRGVPSIALSIEPVADPDLDAAVAFAVALIRGALANPPPPRVVLNVNYPARPTGRYRWTRLGQRAYSDDVTERRDPRGRAYYWIGGGEVDADPTDGTDGHAVSAGLISVTPLFLDLTAHDLLGRGPLFPIDSFELVPTGAP